MSATVTTPRLLIAGTHSGVGKTTVTAALLHALRTRGLRAQPFKVGPDYVDPTHLGHAAGLEARNLDAYLLPPGQLKGTFTRAAARADVAVVEGMMGLYDGREATSDAGSGADLARTLGLPVVLVLDAWGVARSAAAMALGYRAFAADLNFAGVILNRVASVGHADMCAAALEQAGLRTLGFVLREDEITLPERHLGLVLSGELSVQDGTLERAARHLDVDALLEAARTAPPLTAPPAPPRVTGDPAVIAVARDAAFSFYYPDALELLRELGADLRFFSPLADEPVPEGAGALLLGGGYPELHAERLSAAGTSLASVRRFAASGGPVVAECGGLMYLSRSMQDLSGREHRMAGIVPLRVSMRRQPVLGYREVRLRHDSPLGAAGTVLRGHEFHYSDIERADGDDLTHAAAYEHLGAPSGREFGGYAHGNVLATYLHVHLGGMPEAAARLVRYAAAFLARP